MSDPKRPTMQESDPKLYSEDIYESYNLPSFASMIDRFSQGKVELQKSLNKTFSLDDTTTTARESADEASAASEIAKIVKVLDYRRYQCQERDEGVEECKEIEHDAAVFEYNVYLHERTNRLDEAIIHEVDHDSEEEYENDQEDHDSIVSLNPLENNEPDVWEVENCRFAHKPGCLGLIELSILSCREEEAHFTTEDNVPEVSSIYDTEKLNIAQFTANEDNVEVSVFNEIEKSNKPLGDMLVVDEISCHSDDESDTSEITILCAEEEALHYDPFPYNDDPDADDQDRLGKLHVDETESIASDWVQENRQDDNDDDSHESESLVLLRNLDVD